MKKFVEPFERKFEEMEANGEDPRAQFQANIDRQRKTVHART